VAWKVLKEVFKGHNMSHRKITAVSVLGSAIAAGCFISGAAWAQGPQATGPADTSAATGHAAVSGNQLQEVVVTAERRATNVLTTPVSIVVTSGDQLAANNQVTLADLQSTIPNMQIGTQGVYDSINIRGIGNSNINPSIAPGVVVFHDGLPATETLFIQTPFFDIEDIETLRGPQGTLVSAASTGGSVDINSRNPNFSGTDGYIEAQLGNYADQKMDGAVNLPVTDTFAMRFAFNVERMNSFYEDETAHVTSGASGALADPGHVDNNNFRIGALWKPNNAFSALLKVEADYANPGGTAAEPNPGTFQAGPGQLCPNPNEGYGPVCHSPFYQYGTHKPFVLNYGLINLFEKEQQYRSGLDLHYTLSNGIVLRSLTGYQTQDLRYSEDDTSTYVTPQEAPIDYGDIGPMDRYYSEDLTIQSPAAGRITWIAGGAFFYRWTPVHGLSESYPSFPNPGPLQTVEIFMPTPGTDQTNTGTTARNQGLFGNLDWNVTDTLQLTLGLRGNWDQNFSRGNVFVFIGGNRVATVSQASNYSDSTQTGKVGLNWTPRPGQYVYAFAARGYKPGGAQAGGNFLMEHVNDFELGWKGKLLEDHLQMQLGGYYMDYQKMQVQGYNTTTGGAGVQNISGGTTIDGIEFSMQGRFGNFGTTADVAYLHSTVGTSPALIESYRLPLTAANKGQCAPGVTANCFNYLPYEVSVSGEQNAYSPPLTASLEVDYGIPLGDNTLRPRVSFSHTDKQYAGLFQNDDYLLMGSRDLWNVSLSYEAKTWTTEIYCNNCSNRVYAQGMGYIHGGGTIGQDIYYGNPRQFGIRVKRTFQ
jgi:iron complex outermembrane receptor protein